MKISSEAKDEDFSWQVGGIHENSAPMNSDTNSTVHKKRFDWREDLANSRDLSKREIDAYGYVLSWIEDWRVRKDLVAGREAAKRWWLEVAKAKERPEWQLRQWAEAIRWFLGWLEIFEKAGGDARTIPERLKAAVNHAGARRGLALKTRQTYAGWVARFGVFAGTEARVMDEVVGRDFLMHLVEQEKVAFATQKQALNALVFFYRDVCGRAEVDLQVKLRKTGRRAPVILNRGELMGLIGKLEDRYKTPALLQYGAGLRLTELIQLRVKDVDLERGVVTVRAGKGDKDRETILPNCLKDALAAEIARARGFWEEDRNNGTPGVALPGALSRKMPKAGIKWAWMWIFPADHLSKDPESGIIRRHHLHPKSYGEAIVRAAENAGVAKRVTTHALRHAFATDLLAGGTDIRTLQELLGHADVKTTEIYAHAAEIGNGKGVRSPLDRVGISSGMLGIA
jgi:integron integrase